jgi:iron complex transport system ATP-binding protein
MTSILEARGIAMTGRLKSTDIACSPREMIAVIGPNGAGKTSLLRAIAGIELTSGEVNIDGEDLESSPPARRMRLLSFLPATRSLIWPINVRDAIALGLPSPDANRVQDLIEQLELTSLADRPISQLSTGERTRALLARALAAKPRLLLLDEPLSNLDPYWVLKVLEILCGETTTNDCSVLASVHDLNQVAAFDRVLLVDEGRVAADGSPEEILNSPSLSDAFRIERSGSAWRIREGV